MRLLVTMIAVAMMTVAIGCAPKDKAAAPAPAATGGSSATAPADNAAKTKAPDASADVTPDTSNMQTVSLKLPGMT